MYVSWKLVWQAERATGLEPGLSPKLLFTVCLWENLSSVLLSVKAGW